MRFSTGTKIGDWIAFLALATLAAGFVYSCHRHGFS